MQAVNATDNQQVKIWLKLYCSNCKKKKKKCNRITAFKIQSVVIGVTSVRIIYYFCNFVWPTACWKIVIYDVFEMSAIKENVATVCICQRRLVQQSVSHCGVSCCEECVLVTGCKTTKWTHSCSLQLWGIFIATNGACATIYELHFSLNPQQGTFWWLELPCCGILLSLWKNMQSAINLNSRLVGVHLEWLVRGHSLHNCRSLIMLNSRVSIKVSGYLVVLFSCSEQFFNVLLPFFIRFIVCASDPQTSVCEFFVWSELMHPCVYACTDKVSTWTHTRKHNLFVSEVHTLIKRRLLGDTGFTLFGVLNAKCFLRTDIL